MASIFDRFRRKELTSKEAGVSGTQITSGIITGEEYVPKLSGESALKTYNEMRSNDATVEASLSLIKTPLLGADYHVDSATDDDADQDVAEFVRKNLFEIVDFSQFKSEALTYLDFGFSLFEMVFEPQDVDGTRRIVLKKLAFRKQTTITAWEQSDHSAGVTQTSAGHQYSIPLAKLVRFTNRQEGDNYVGRSVLRAAYKHWYIKDKLYRIDAVGHERHALGVIDITVPKNANEKDKRAVRRAAQALRASERAYIEHPEDFTIQFMDPKAKSLKDVEPSINHHDRQIMKNVLASFMEIGAAGSSGTRSTSEDQSRIFAQAVENVGKYIVEVLQDHVVETLVDLNFSNVKEYPKLRIGKTSDDNVPVLSDAIQKYVVAGVLHPRPEDENTVRKQVGWAEVDVDDLTADYQPKKTVTDDDMDKDKLEASTELRALRASVEKALHDQRAA